MTPQGLVSYGAEDYYPKYNNNHDIIITRQLHIIGSEKKFIIS